MSVKVFLGIGTNLNKDNSIRFALLRLKELLGDIDISSVYESRAIREAEPDYYNMVVRAQCPFSFEELCEHIQTIEMEAGVEMMFYNGTNFGPKPRLDIDVLTYGDTVATRPCKVPRHDIQDYPFVLCPLTEIEPEFEHPLLKIKVCEIWSEMHPRLPEKMHVAKVDFDFNKEFENWDN